MSEKSCRSNDQDLIAYQTGKENVESDVTQEVEAMKSESKDRPLNEPKHEKKLSNFNKLYSNRKWPAMVKQTQQRRLEKTTNDVLNSKMSSNRNSAPEWNNQVIYFYY